VREDIKAYLDGELSPERAQEVRLALESDPALMEEYTAMKNISGMLQSLARQPQVKGVEQTRTALAPRRAFRWREGLAVAATLALLAVLLSPVFMKAKFAAKTDTTAVNGVPEDAARNKSLADGYDPAERMTSKIQGGDVETKNEGFSGFTLPPATEQRPRHRAEGNAPAGAGGAPALLGGQPEAMYGADATALASKDFDARLVIKDASFTVEVGDVQGTMDKATQLARSLGGYIEASTMSGEGQRDERPRGYLTLRVPQEKFESAVEQVRQYGKVKSESTSGDDVTGQVADIEARMNTLKAEEESLRTILRTASKIGDILEIKDRISQVRQQIESYDSQQRMLKRLAALSTVSLTFVTDEDAPAPVTQEDEDEWFEDTKAAALSVLTGIGRFVAQVATFAFILSPVWLPVLLFLLWFRRRAFVPQA
jgi:hypothetical protein